MPGDDINVEVEGVAKTIAKLETYEALVTEQRVPQAMGEIGLKMAMETQRNITANGQVESGTMRASIDFDPEKSGAQAEVHIGSNIEYSPYQEAINPFLQPAVEENLGYAETKLKEAVDVGGF